MGTALYEAPDGSGPEVGIPALWRLPAAASDAAALRSPTSSGTEYVSMALVIVFGSRFHEARMAATSIAAAPWSVCGNFTGRPLAVSVPFGSCTQVSGPTKSPPSVSAVAVGVGAACPLVPGCGAGEFPAVGLLLLLFPLLVTIAVSTSATRTRPITPSRMN